MGPTVVILQPSYIPWRGYFDLIRRADVFVFYDDVQYDKHGWRNRNRIKTAQGTRWLTIPVHPRTPQGAPLPIDAVEIDWRQPWNRKHWETIRQSYAKAPYFDRLRPLLEHFYLERRDLLLADFTIALTAALAAELGLTTRFCRARDLPAQGSKTDRLISLLTGLGAAAYLSGPSAASYLEPAKFAAAGIELAYIRYDYQEYPQLYPPFDPQVSLLDLLAMTGPDARAYLEAPHDPAPPNAPA
jgi:hypothetical protein